jgi:hypothetical protein
MPQATAPDNQRPIHTVRHRNLKAAIWRNVTDKGVIFSVVVTRSYRDKATNQWHDTHSLGYDDLMNVVALLQDARAFIATQMAKERRKATAKPAPKTPTRPGPLLP